MTSWISCSEAEAGTRRRSSAESPHGNSSATGPGGPSCWCVSLRRRLGQLVGLTRFASPPPSAVLALTAIRTTDAHTSRPQDAGAHADPVSERLLPRAGQKVDLGGPSSAFHKYRRQPLQTAADGGSSSTTPTTGGASREPKVSDHKAPLVGSGSSAFVSFMAPALHEPANVGAALEAPTYTSPKMKPARASAMNPRLQLAQKKAWERRREAGQTSRGPDKDPAASRLARSEARKAVWAARRAAGAPKPDTRAKDPIQAALNRSIANKRRADLMRESRSKAEGSDSRPSRRDLSRQFESRSNQAHPLATGPSTQALATMSSASVLPRLFRRAGDQTNFGGAGSAFSQYQHTRHTPPIAEERHVESSRGSTSASTSSPPRSSPLVGSGRSAFSPASSSAFHAVMPGTSSAFLESGSPRPHTPIHMTNPVPESQQKPQTSPTRIPKGSEARREAALKAWARRREAGKAGVSRGPDRAPEASANRSAARKAEWARKRAAGEIRNTRAKDPVEAHFNRSAAMKLRYVKLKARLKAERNAADALAKNAAGAPPSRRGLSGRNLGQSAEELSLSPRGLPKAGGLAGSSQSASASGDLGNSDLPRPSVENVSGAGIGASLTVARPGLVVGSGTSAFRPYRASTFVHQIHLPAPSDTQAFSSSACPQGSASPNSHCASRAGGRAVELHKKPVARRFTNSQETRARLSATTSASWDRHRKQGSTAMKRRPDRDPDKASANRSAAAVAREARRRAAKMRLWYTGTDAAAAGRYGSSSQREQSAGDQGEHSPERTLPAQN